MKQELFVILVDEESYLKEGFDNTSSFRFCEKNEATKYERAKGYHIISVYTQLFPESTCKLVST